GPPEEQEETVLSPDLTCPPAALQMVEMLNGVFVSQAVSVAATLGIADLLADSPKTADQLAAATGTHAPSLYRLLRALTSIGIFAEDRDHQFTLTPLAGCLRSDSPDSIRNVARFSGLPLSWRAWGELLYCVTTGEPSFKRAGAVSDPFGYLSRHPE